MSHMRSLRRGVLKAKGTFVPQKVYRTRPDNSRQTFLNKMVGLHNAMKAFKNGEEA